MQSANRPWRTADQQPANVDQVNPRIESTDVHRTPRPETHVMTTHQPSFSPSHAIGTLAIEAKSARIASPILPTAPPSDLAWPVGLALRMNAGIPIGAPATHEQDNV